jgi:hypothetical protein
MVKDKSGTAAAPALKGDPTGKYTLNGWGQTEAKKAAVYIEMFKAINAGVLVPQEPRSLENSTPTSFEQFVQDVFVAAYHGKAITA